MKQELLELFVDNIWPIRSSQRSVLSLLFFLYILWLFWLNYCPSEVAGVSASCCLYSWNLIKASSSNYCRWPWQGRGDIGGVTLVTSAHSSWVRTVLSNAIAISCIWSKVKLCAPSCPTLCDPMDSSPPGLPIHEILQTRVLEWVAILSPRGSSQPMDQTHISLVSYIGRRILYQLSHQINEN